jgi:uroporphyrinogen-III synthase
LTAPCDLGGRGVLVTRPAGQAEGLCRLIEDAGGRAIAFPTIAIAPIADPEPARRRLAEPWDLLIFVSRNAVEQALSLCPGGHLPAGGRLAAVGAATAKALAKVGRAPDLVPAGRYDSEAVLADPSLAEVAGWRVLIVRGEGGRTRLADTLTARGAEVAYAEVYRRALPEADATALVARWSQEIQLVTATSGEVLDNLLALVGEGGRAALLATPLVVVSERTAVAAGEHGFRRVELAERADEVAIVAALCRLVASAGPGWSHFVHGADIGVEGRGADLASAFEQAALALTAVITDPATVEPRNPVAVVCEGPDPELLLVDWLNALIYEMATRHLLFGRFAVTLDDGRLTATAWGEPVDLDRHHPAVEVKGATYTALAVTQDPDGTWTARCVVDV